jgi:methylmalonyl-CoA mutase cobalamin-binding subunit
MKYFLPKVTVMLSMFFSVAVSAELPTLVNQRAAAETKIGVVSVSGISGSSDDAVKKLQEKAEAIGGSKLYVFSLGTPGDSSHWMGNAEVYR